MVNRLLLLLLTLLVGAATLYFIQDKNRPLRGGRPVNDFALLDLDGTFHKLSDYSSSKTIVVFAYNPDCPTNRKGLAALKSLKTKLDPSMAAFLVLHTTAGKFNILDPDRTDITILRDESLVVAESLGLMYSGEVLVIDPTSWTIRYRGPIDNRSDYESEQPEISRHYLHETIESIAGGNPVTVNDRASIGCLIDYEMQPNPTSISYADTVAPILQKNCLGCHFEGGIGPWAMDSHASVKAWATKIRQAILLQTMPPWHADPAIGEFKYSRRLKRHDRKTLVRWINAGSPAGNDPDPLATYNGEETASWPLGKPDITLKLPTFKIPAEGILAYQYAKVEVPIDADTWVRAVHMKPSNLEATHHIFAFVEYPKDRKDQQPIWAEGANGFFAAYVPGFPVVPFPENSGRLLPKGSKIIFQRHYLTIGHATEDDLQFGLYLHQKPPAMEYKMATAINMKLKIPPHAKTHSETASVTIPETGELHAIYPHMHYRGKSMRFKATFPDGSEQLLLSVPNYNFHWQTSYQLKQSLHLPAGTRIDVGAEFDNSANNPMNPDPETEVRWGPLSSDEMLVGYLMYTRNRNATEPALEKTGKSRQ